jgi:type IV secretion system protein VirD4
MNSEGHAGATNAVLVLLGAAFAAGAAVWAGAQLASRLFGSGRWLDVGLDRSVVALARLRDHAADPERAWPRGVRDDLPGPAAYWACTAAMLVLVGAAAVAALTVVWRPGVSGRRRRRLGVDAQARLARRGDLRSLVVAGPIPGRLILGRFGRHLVATEDRDATAGGRARRRHRRQGDRSSVLVVGPTRCGKTANAISGVLEWSGPAILSSVKSDLMGATIAQRRRVGRVRVFDPTGSTGERCAGWSPLRAAHTITGAQKAARALCDAGPRAGAENLDFFLRLAEQVLWPLLWTAAVSGRQMGDVVRWALVQDRPTSAGPGEVAPLIETQLYRGNDERRRAAQHAWNTISAAWVLDERTRSSAYATVQTLIAPWADPSVAAASSPQQISLEWLCSGANTLYLCAPQHEQARLAPVFGGLLGDLVQQAFERVGRSNQPLPPTLLVMDEAGNTPTRWLPGVASTCAGIGVLLVTIWQSKSQIDAAYGRLADSVITNHGTKILFSGISDLATLDFTTRLVGDEEIPRLGESIEFGGAGRRSVTESTHSTRLVPAHLLRQVRPGEALLVHGTLPPAHLHARPYYRDRRLAHLATSGRVRA